jgi:supervillin
MNITNMVYRLDDDELDPVEDFWGKPLKHAMLNEREAFIFDFGAEMYMWAGKKCSLDKRRKALRLEEDLWNTGYDYSECDINPLCPLASKEVQSLHMLYSNECFGSR